MVNDEWFDFFDVVDIGDGVLVVWLVKFFDVLVIIWLMVGIFVGIIVGVVMVYLLVLEGSFNKSILNGCILVWWVFSLGVFIVVFKVDD